jgi:hypothetical protein
MEEASAEQALVLELRAAAPELLRDRALPALGLFCREPVLASMTLASMTLAPELLRDGALPALGLSCREPVLASMTLASMTLASLNLTRLWES